MSPVAYTRVYRDCSGPEYPATPDLIRVAMKSMLEHAKGDHAFKLRLRMDDGASVTVKPKGWAS